MEIIIDEVPLFYDEKETTKDSQNRIMFPAEFYGVMAERNRQVFIGEERFKLTEAGIFIDSRILYTLNNYDNLSKADISIMPSFDIVNRRFFLLENSDNLYIIPNLEGHLLKMPIDAYRILKLDSQGRFNLGKKYNDFIEDTVSFKGAWERIVLNLKYK